MSLRFLARVKNWLVPIFITGTLIWFLATRLAFAPVPWPDGSAFYLPGLDFWKSWPPSWKMHAQAAFVPSYDRANFNTMPALPLLLGLGNEIGLTRLFGAVQATRVLSFIPFWGWAWVIWSWSCEVLSEMGLNRRRSAGAAFAILCAALFDPVVRWGTLVVRTETWIGFFWLLLLRELWRQRNAPDRLSQSQAWKIATLLAASAYFHFEAILILPATVLGLVAFPFRFWLRKLIQVALRTLVLLAPWLLYVVLNFSLFKEQMDVQFHRLEHGNHYIATFYGLFHSLFISHGSPVSWPKFFNLGKAIFWVMILGCFSVTFLEFYRSFRSFRSFRLFKDQRRTWVSLSAFLAFLTSLYLWATKPEVWFTTLCHLTFWPWFICTLSDSRTASRKALLAFAATYALISLPASWVQERQIEKAYSWGNYAKWIDCIDAQIQSIKSEAGKSVWQPHIPDVLVELADRHPDYDLTRALDFPSQESLVKPFIERVDSVVLSTYFNIAPETTKFFEGDPRKEDLERMTNGIEVPYGNTFLENLKTQPGRWIPRVCQAGPFWAVIMLSSRKPATH